MGELLSLRAPLEGGRRTPLVPPAQRIFGIAHRGNRSPGADRVDRLNRIMTFGKKQRRRRLKVPG
ncbi:MAG: hypothetical protein M3P53_02505 [Actinomycetota bacterium]|nr:hypothetical protein [Actinomycetota bacterium]